MTITIGSLSSGYGGLEMALSAWLGADRADVRWHSEIDADASRVLKTWWPEVPNLGSFADDDFWERAERVHLMCGGIPCQPFSSAGRQLGEADARHLWPFWRRGIELHRPATVVFENVANLTRGKMRPTFDAIIADLLTLGYDVRWCLLGACAVGAAHHRHRVFLLACRTRTTPSVAQVTVQTCGQHVAMRELLPTPSAVSYGNNRGGAAGRTGPVRHSLDALARLELLPATAGRDGSTRGEGSPDFWERRRAQGGTRAVAGVTLGAALSLLPSPRGRGLPNHPGHGARVQGAQGLATVASRELGELLPTPRHTDARNGGPGQGFGNADGRDRPAPSSAVQPERWGKYVEAIARHETVLGRPAPEPTEIGSKGGRRLAAAFSEWLMMLPEGHLTTVLDRNPALARAGNGVVPLQAATALRLLFADLTGRR